jgi:hypothetical protein
MFRAAPVAVTEPTHDMVVPAEQLVPLSHLELDLPAPATGWLIELDRRGVEVLTDDVGRLAVSRAAARELISEHRGNEARKRELAARTEQQAIEADRQWRRQLWGGIPAVDLPPGVTAAQAMFAADRDAQPRRRSVLEEALGNSDTLTYHPLPSTDDES